jgi:hypothetical protein
MTERPKGTREQAAEQFEPAAAGLPTSDISEAALASIAISLRRIADTSIFAIGHTLGDRALTKSVSDAADIAVHTKPETWEAAIRLAQARKDGH